MARIGRLSWVLGFVACAWMCVGVALAGDAAELGRLLRDAQSQYFRGKADEAGQTLQKAEKMLLEIQSKGSDSEKSKAKLIRGQIEKLRKDIDKKLGKATGSGTAAVKSATETGQAAASAAGSAAAGVIPEGMKSAMKGVDMALENGREWLAKGDARVARRQVDNAREQLSKIERAHGKLLSPPPAEYAALQARVDELDRAVKAAEAKAAQVKDVAGQALADAKTSSTLWLARLKPYAMGPGQPGHDPKSYFVAGYTESEQELVERMKIFGRVSEAMEAYRKSGMDKVATEELRQMTRNLDHAMEGFKESCQQMAEVNLGKCESALGDQWAKAEAESKKIGSGALPVPISKDVFQQVRRDLDRAANLLGESDAQVKELRKKYNDLVELNGRLLKARVSETRMQAEKFAGAEKSALRSKAEEVARAKYPRSQILRVTLISPDWVEESVVEWTDSTRSALRHRITQSVSAQVALKRDADVRVCTIHLSRDRKSGGGWAVLQGHVMFEDPILEENVKK